MPVLTNEDLLYCDCSFCRRPAGLPYWAKLCNLQQVCSPKKDIMLLHRGDCSKSRSSTPDTVTFRVPGEL